MFGLDTVIFCCFELLLRAFTSEAVREKWNFDCPPAPCPITTMSYETATPRFADSGRIRRRGDLLADLAEYILSFFMEPTAEFLLEGARTERLLRELHLLSREAGVILTLPSSGYINTFYVTMKVSKGAYLGRQLTFMVDVPHKWPQIPPRFLCGYRRMFHPNVSSDGRVCLNLLRDDYEPSYTLVSLLMAILCVVEEPGLEHPLNLDAAKAVERGEWEKIVSAHLQHEQGINTFPLPDEQPVAQA